MRGENAHWHSVPTSRNAQPQAMSIARPGAPHGPKNGNFRNGNWTAEAIEERRWLRSLVQLFATTG
jgi:hypothetical protein